MHFCSSYSFVAIIVFFTCISVFMALPNLSRSETHESKNKSIDYMEDEKYKSYCIQEILLVLISITIFIAALKISSKSNLLTRTRNLLSRLLNYFGLIPYQEVITDNQQVININEEVLTDNQQVINTDQEVTIYQRNLEDKTDVDDYAIAGPSWRYL